MIGMTHIEYNVIYMHITRCILSFKSDSMNTFPFLIVSTSSWFSAGPNVNASSMSLQHDEFCTLSYVKPQIKSW